jgi:adenylate cyclase
VATAQDNLTNNSIRSWSDHPWMLRLISGQGRAAALGFLIIIALIYIAFGELGWSPARNLLFDGYQRMLPRAVERFPAVIVDIDDASLAAYGRWPWPRTRLAQLIEATHRLGALAVGLDMIMPEADTLSPQQLLAERQDASPHLRDAVAALPSNDAILADMLRRVPTVAGRAALIDGAPDKGVKTGQTPVVVFGEPPMPFVQNYAGQLTNIPEIEAASAGRGYLNDTRDGDGVVRTMPLVIDVNGELAPAMAVELLRVAGGQTQYVVRSDRRGVLGIQIGTSFIPTDSDGRLRIYYSPANPERRVSAAAILRGTLAPKALAHQVAIIGATAVGISDVAATPVAARDPLAARALVGVAGIHCVGSGSHRSASSFCSGLRRHDLSWRRHGSWTHQLWLLSAASFPIRSYFPGGGQRLGGSGVADRRFFGVGPAPPRA